MNRPRKGIARGINWILGRAGADFEAVQDERGTGQFEGTSKAEVIRAFNYLERLIRDAKSPRKLQLFVWVGFAPDSTDGLAFAVAYSEEQARQLVVEDYGLTPSDWGTLKIHPLNRHIAYAVGGGG